MRARMCVDSPGSRRPLTAVALTQPHETRTLAMLTTPRVLLVTRKGCDKVGPRGTEPKSLENSSKSASAQVADKAGPAAHRPTRTTRLYRNMINIPATTLRDSPGATRRKRNEPPRVI